MFRLSKLSDYGIVILAHLARGEDASVARNAREVAEAVALPAPAVSKVLKLLARSGVVTSQRGSKGGYQLAHRPEDITVAEMVTALEGPVAMTECTAGPHLCSRESRCAVKDPWHVINEVVRGALEGVTLADLIDPLFLSSRSPLQILQVGGAERNDEGLPQA